ncbi:MAG: glycosyltransferase family 4 protein [Treponema sp.]|nr:glycosyltransferase family 4 protein [Treponema sp.]
MNISIDCRMINSSGIGVYLRGCLPYFINSGNNFLLIGNYKQLKSYESFPNVKIVNCDIKPFSLIEIFFFPAIIKKQINNIDVFYSPYFNIPKGITIPVYTTIHDILFPDMPGVVSKTGLFIRMWFFRRAYKISKLIFTVSEFSKSRITHHLGTSKRIIVTHNAVQQIILDYKNNIKNIQKKETIIFIGNIKKHKGLNCLLDAFKLARNEGFRHQLIIVGSDKNHRSSDKAIIKKINTFEKGAINFTGHISDEKLLELLSSASLLVQPSLYEGFCYPPLEAMVIGTQALISDIPVLKEVYSEYPVVYFKAGDPIDLKEKLTELLLNNKQQVISLPEHLLNKYTFNKTASIILNNLSTDN